MTIPIEKLKAMLSYDPATGHFHWLADIRNGRGHRAFAARKGTRAGGVGQDGYWRFRLDRHLILAHRAAFAMMTGEWPPHHVDHIDSDCSNNAWSNLRLASGSENNRNRGKQRNNTSGFKGVTKSTHSNGRKWKAAITVKGVCFHLGYHDSPAEAHEAYRAAVATHHGEFARAE